MKGMTMANSKKPRRKSREGMRIPQIHNKEDKDGRFNRMSKDDMRRIQEEADRRLEIERLREGV